MCCRQGRFIYTEEVYGFKINICGFSLSHYISMTYKRLRFQIRETFLSHTSYTFAVKDRTLHDLTRLTFITFKHHFVIAFNIPNPNRSDIIHSVFLQIYTLIGNIDNGKKIYLSANHTTNYNLPKLHHKKGNLCLIGAPSSINQ